MGYRGLLKEGAQTYRNSIRNIKFWLTLKIARDVKVVSSLFFFQVGHQQKDEQRKCGPATEWSR